MKEDNNMRETINFCGKECKVLERYEVSEEYARKYKFSYRKRIKFEAPDGQTIDCANTF